MTVKLDIRGDKELIRTFARFKASAQKRMARAATRKALSPINKQAKANLKANQRTRQLAKSLGIVMVRAGRVRIPGAVVGHVKPRRGYRIMLGGRGIDPAKYSHLVESGAKAHAIVPKNRQAMSFEVGGDFLAASIVRHPGFSGFGFMRKAFMLKGRTALGVFTAEIAKQIPKEVARARRSGR